MNRVRLMIAVALIAGVLTVVLATDLPSIGAALGLAGPDQESPEALLHRALEQANEAGSFEISVSLDQTVRQEHPLRFGTPDETAHFEIEGAVAKPDRARMSIVPGRTSFALAQTGAQEFLTVDGKVYRRVGERWVESQSNVPATEVDGLGLSLLSVARDVAHLEPAAGPPALGELAPSFRRVSFNLYPDDVRDYFLRQQGVYDTVQVQLARLGAPIVEGSGELWLDDAGLPARLVLHLEWVERNQDPYRVLASITTDYGGFGQQFPDSYFDPLASTQTGAPLPRSMADQWPQYGMWVFAALGVLFLAWLLFYASKRWRWVAISITITLVITLLTPSLAPVAEAAGIVAKQEADQTERTPAAGSEVAKMLDETRRLMTRHTNGDSGPAGALNDEEDEDGDKLPNGYELRLGTSPYSKDSDYDGLSDYVEVKGYECEWVHNGQPQTSYIVTDPLNPDSNDDGLPDGQEVWRGECAEGVNRNGFFWDDDNDDDGVPDGIDLSPFSKSAPEIYGGDEDGPNLVFETLDQDPGPGTTLYPFYVELQVRPTNTESLRWAYKNLYWPEDHKGAIQSNGPMGTLIAELFGEESGAGGKMELVPFLQAIVTTNDLPSQEAMDHYGVNVSELEDEEGNWVIDPSTMMPLYEMTLPLVPIERGGQVYAFQAKMLHDQNTNADFTRHWHDVRLKWAAIGDVLMANSEGELVPNPHGGYGIMVYDEQYVLTGLQVSRQGGASVLLAAALPSPGEPYDDGPISLLRAGMEARFLPGALSMAEIKDRFDTPNSATEEKRWGIPQDQEYRVMYDPATMTFEHLDEAIATTTMTTTVQMLDQNFDGYENLEPTVILASDQRTSTVNLDDDPPADYAEFTINTCLKPMMSSRSLKLQTYRWEMEGLEGGWTSLTLDEVLQKIEIEYGATTPENYEFYFEELNILKLAATAWQIGQTAAYKIANAFVYQSTNIMSDPQVLFKLLDENGLLPEYFLDAVKVLMEVWEAGGPLKWFEQQWNKVTSAIDKFGETIKGSFLDFSSSNSPPSDAVSGAGDGGGGGQEPPMSAEAFEEKLLSWTDTAIKILSTLASVTGLEFFSQVAEVLTKAIEIYKMLRKLVDTVKAIADVLKNTAKPLQAVTDMLVKGLAGLGQQLSFLGLIVGVWAIWAGLMMSLAAGDYGPLATASLILKAIIQTAMLVALFVLALLFPWGTVIAGIIGLVTMLSDLIGVPLDPISLLVELLTPVQVDLTGYAGADFDPLAIEPLHPGGAMIVREPFRVQVEGDIYIGTYPEGTPADLMLSDAQLYVRPDTTWPWWDWGWGQVDWADPYIGYPPYQAADGAYHRKFHQRAGVDLTPWHHKINSAVALYAQTRMTIRYAECTAGEVICNDYSFTGWSGRSPLPILYFDLLPHKLDDLWHWEELLNRDPDGDGLEGYVDPGNGELIGPDADLCPGSYVPSRNDWDTDDDGLSDKFELENEGFDPCEEDSDGDEVTDRRELFKGTRPDKPDTDGDGLTDREEDVYSDGFNLQWPWIVDMGDLYPGLPDPVAFPNPRHANLDGDYLRDSQEKEKRTSPNSMNPPPVGEPLELWITQDCAPNQGTEITITSSPWANEEQFPGIGPELELTLPVEFTNITRYAGLRPLMIQLPNDSTMSMSTATSQWWRLPFIFPTGRYVYATYSGNILGPIPTEPVSITARLEYQEAGATQVSTETVPLRVNVGGPTTRLVDVLGATVLGRGTFPLQAAGSASFDRLSAPQANGSVLIAAHAGDPEWLKELFVCVKATSDKCGARDWQPATLVPHTPFWLYEFTPPADGIYYARAYAIDGCGTSGPPSNAWTLGVDQTRPAGVRFDQDDAVYLTSTAIDEQPAISFSGWATDTAHAPYVSGVDWVGFLADLTPLGTTSVAQPGQVSSSFVYSWTLPEGRLGASMYGHTPAHDLLVGIADVAGNIGTVSDTLRIVVDDTPPLAYANPPQTLGAGALTLSGLADDTALLFERGPLQPYDHAHTQSDSDAAFNHGADMGSAVIAGDVSGDQIDDVVLLVSAKGEDPEGLEAYTPFSAGLFLGRPEGLSGELNLADADVVFTGELPVPATITNPPTAAAIGDVNGDGLDDLLLGDPSANMGVGKAYVLLGRRDWPTTVDLSSADWVLSITRSVGFGSAVSAAGDVNGDGLADFMVGATSDGAREGVVWLYLGREQEAAPAHRALFHPDAATPAPPRLAGLGDTNGDGLSDFLIAAAGVPVALVYGRPDDEWPTSPVNLAWEAAALFAGLGPRQTVSPAGDLNGDDLRDMLIGDPVAREAQRVFIVYGRRPEDPWEERPPEVMLLTEVADASFIDRSAERLGESLVELGDVDGDGRSDFAFGQPGAGTIQTRVAIILSEKRTLTPDMPVEAATHIITGPVPGWYFGNPLSAGDANGDHVPDLLIGAAGNWRSYLFHGGFDPGDVSGIGRVELGLFGPVVDPTQPFTSTLPAAWESATLAQPNERISTWRGELAVPEEGDYRIYARAQDQVGNMQESETWYLGNMWFVKDPEPTDADLTMEPAVLDEQTNLTLSGAVKSASLPFPIQHLRVYNGYEWQRLQPETGPWSWESVLPRFDQRTLTFRAVARDAFGTTLHATSSMRVDTRVGELPKPTGNLPLFLWHTDISPTLVISWPVVSDANGIVQTWASIDTSEQTSPATPVSTNEIKRVLDAPGVYYGHVRVQDGAGNEAIGHIGPYPVNRTRTPSVILPDGKLSTTVGEYPASTLLNYDPYAVQKPASLYGTWDADSLYLGYPGYDWGPEKLFSVYLDTTPGGVTGTLAPISDTHTLPFAADYAFVVGEAGSLYSAASGDWVLQSSPQSYAVTHPDAEMVLDRSEIQATGAVSMLAYIEDDHGVQVVLPPEARPDGNRVLVGPTTFVGNFYWPALGDGLLPNEGQGQVISPTVTIERAWDNVVNSGQATTMWVHVGNPDPKAYDMETLVVEADREMVWNRVEGATCIDCPAESGRWTLGVDVAAGGTQTVTLEAQVQGSTATGVVPIKVTASLPNSGLPVMEVLSSDTTGFALDRGTAEIGFARPEETIYARPGAAGIPFFPDTGGMGNIFERCEQHVEANVDGQGWVFACNVGDCIEVATGILDQFGQQEVELQVVGANGCTSDPISKIVVADSVSPTVQIAPRVAYSGTLAFVRGTAWDEFPTSRTPERVEVSIDGGRFRQAFLSAVPVAQQGIAQSEPISMAQWLFPLHLTSQDGVTVTLSARAVDEAGNVGPASDPITITLDNIGPTLTVSQTDSLLEGTIHDGSGVAAFEISLDGGLHYEPVTWVGEDWTFDMASWSGSALQSFALLHAVDVVGNDSHTAFPIDFELQRVYVYLPLIMRSSPGRESTTPALDNVGPTVTVTQTGNLLEGTIHDDSGVDSFEISLDGGLQYEPVALAGENWTFDMATWTGSLPQSVAMLHAVDVWGNDSHIEFPIDLPLERVYLYLPLVVRSKP